MSLFLKPKTQCNNDDNDSEWPLIDFYLMMDWVERLILQMLETPEEYNSRVMPRI